MPDEPFWDRAHLYRQVWAKPLTRLAPEYGVSATALRKVCQKLNVPLPGRRHWAKATKARCVPPPPLPISNGSVVVRKGKTQESTRLARAGEKESHVHEAPASAEFQQVRLVAESAVLLRRAPVDYRGIIKAPNDDACLDLRVSKTALQRALRISSRLLQLLNLAGIPVRVELQRRAVTKARVFQQDVQFAIIEETRVRAVLNDLRELPVTPPAEDPCTGRLRIQILECAVKGLRKRWSDGDKYQVEDLLPSCVSGFKALGLLLRVAAVTDGHPAGTAEKDLNTRLRRTQLQRRQFRNLLKMVEQWNQARLVREFINAVEQTRGSTLASRKDSAKNHWINWAREEADKLDPLAIHSRLPVDRKRT